MVKTIRIIYNFVNTNNHNATVKYINVLWMVVIIIMRMVNLIVLGIFITITDYDNANDDNNDIIISNIHHTTHGDNNDTYYY